MNDSRPQVARARRAARRNYLILCAFSIAAMTALVVAASILID